MNNEERRFKALDVLLDYSKGTLWWVKDRIWDEVIPEFKKKRQGHPGLSISRRRAQSLYDVVPMLIGTSKYPGRSVKVSNLRNPEEAGERTTYFSVLRPYPIRFNEFGSSEGVCANSHKPRIDKCEAQQLDVFLRLMEASDVR